MLELDFWVKSWTCDRKTRTLEDEVVDGEKMEKIEIGG